jgi:hypothetical protein
MGGCRGRNRKFWRGFDFPSLLLILPPCRTHSGKLKNNRENISPFFPLPLLWYFENLYFLQRKKRKREEKTINFLLFLHTL